MIAKITSGSSVKGMVAYHYRDKKKSQLLGVNLIEGETKEDIFRRIEFQNEKNNKRVAKPNIHVSLNFHKKDILNNQELKAIADEYMENMGYGSQPYAIYKHTDKEHPHLHIVSSRINDNGKKIKDSFEFRKSVSTSEKIERKYSITVAKEQGRKNIIFEEDHIKKMVKNYKDGIGSVSKILENSIGYALKMFPTNKEEFEKGLNKNEIESFQTNKKNFVYRVKGENQVGISSSEMLNVPNSQKMNEIFKENLKRKQNFFRVTMGKTYSAINTKGITKLSELELILRKKGIRLEVKRRRTGKEEGKINGYIFHDRKNGVRYTATDFKLKLKNFDNIKDDLQNNKKVTEEKSISKIFKGNPYERFYPNFYEEDSYFKSMKKKKKYENEFSM